MKKTVVITGGTGGIGQAIAKEFNPEEYTVHALGSDDLDVRSWSSCKAVMSNLKPDILITCAGVIYPEPLSELDTAQIKGMVDVNLIGTINAIRAALPEMEERGSGLIIALASYRAIVTSYNRGVYSATKAGVRAITESVNHDEITGIRAMSICPDTVDTPMGRALDDGDLIDPSVISDTVQYLVNLPENVIIPEVVLIRRSRYE